MRINPLGIYTQKGLIRDDGQSGLTRRNSFEPGISSPAEIENKKATLAPLTTAESSQIKKLFGNFDMSILAHNNLIGADGVVVDDGPGQIIDIVV